MRILIRNGMVFDGNAVREADVLIDGEKVEAVGKNLSRTGKATIIDARGKVVLPGFICAHHHLYSTFARGMSIPGEPAKNFIEILEKLWWPLDKALDAEDLYLSALYALGECIKSGTTTIIDHHESQNFQEGSLDVIASACEKAGIKAALTLGASDRYGKGAEGISENRRFLEKNKSPFLKGMAGLHAAFTAGEETLKETVQLSKEFDCGIHIHVAEAESDERDSLKKFGMPIVERLEKAQALGKKTILVHCVHINEKEMDIIKKNDSIVVQNPESNMNNGVGWADVLKMINKGILVGLGTDGMSSDMLKQMRCAYLIARHSKSDPRVGFSEAPKMLLDGNREIAKRIFDMELGVIKKGAQADVVVMDYLPPTPLNSGNFLGHLLFGLANATVETTIANGKILMKNRKILVFDEEELSQKCVKRAKKFWKKFAALSK